MKIKQTSETIPDGQASKPVTTEKSPEVQTITDAAIAYVKKHDGNCCVVFSVVAFTPKNEIFDERILFAGSRSYVKAALDCVVGAMRDQNLTVFATPPHLQKTHDALEAKVIADKTAALINESPEVQAIKDATNAYVKKHNNNCCVVLSALAFTPKDKMVDQKIVVAGRPFDLSVTLDCLVENLLERNILERIKIKTKETPSGVTKADCTSPALRNLLAAIEEYVDVYDGNATVVLAVCAYDEDAVLEDRQLLIGDKELIEMDMENLSEHLADDSETEDGFFATEYWRYGTEDSRRRLKEFHEVKELPEARLLKGNTSIN